MLTFNLPNHWPYVSHSDKALLCKIRQCIMDNALVKETKRLCVHYLVITVFLKQDV
jgi:hypothetical protein